MPFLGGGRVGRTAQALTPAVVVGLCRVGGHPPGTGGRELPANTQTARHCGWAYGLVLHSVHSSALGPNLKKESLIDLGCGVPRSSPAPGLEPGTMMTLLSRARKNLPLS